MTAEAFIDRHSRSILPREMFSSAPVKREHQPIQVYEMMTRLGIEQSGSVLPQLGLRYATAFHRCEACPNKEACRDWLDQTPGLVSFAPRFCPDADILFELQFDQPGPSPTSTSQSSSLSH